ncbi:membrane protein insertase YidC [Crossiella sp. SN42]|uniref:membrane protein insertase YidC n=1 Tax=Crossiella sp. SN42 TaxID=2944808 RepID=UPI00207D13D4|nr:membrane protein insertase YidC [Crossiella sp. SN42]MCO1581359.1 membrane protein insertase YidC [Crossiella sp. SN42]
MLDFINYPVSAIMWFWHKVLSYVIPETSGVNWALSVMLLVFTLRALLFKPFVKQVRSMRKMAEFQPQLAKLREKYGNDKQRMAQEMQKLQAEGGFNPLGGCLPMLVQMPVFLGLLNVLQGFKPGATSNYIFGQPEVSSFLASKLFGVNLSAAIRMSGADLAVIGTDRTALLLLAIPLMVLASVLTHLTARHSVARQSATAAANPQSAMMNKLMLYLFPLAVLVGGPFFPVAMLLYWLSNNTWTLGQQYVVYHRIDREEEEKKAAAIEKRQNLGPKPGQKPQPGQKPAPGQKPVRKRPANAAPQAASPTTSSADKNKDTSASTGSEKSNAPRNGSDAAKSTDSAAAKPGEVPGIIQSRSTGKKQTRKRR